MQISRHWRMKNQRYRLEGVRYANGDVQLQQRPAQPEAQPTNEKMPVDMQPVRVAVSVQR